MNSDVPSRAPAPKPASAAHGRLIDFSSELTRLRTGFTGREWLFRKIDAWWDDPDAARCLIVAGEPGIGKSALVAQLVEHRLEEVGAYHLCIARRNDTVDVSLFARSLAAQLARLPGFAECLLESKGVEIHASVSTGPVNGPATIQGVHVGSLTIQQRSPAEEFLHLVQDPLVRLYASGFTRRLVIVVDGLDEAVQYQGRETIARVLADGIDGFPRPVRFLFTSRPDGCAIGPFTDRGVPLILVSADDEDNLHDVEDYLRRRLAASQPLRARADERGVSENVFVARVCQASEGNFLYVVNLLPSMVDKIQAFDRIEDLPKGLDGIYREFLRTRKLADNADRWEAEYEPLLAVLAVAREPLTFEQVAMFTGLAPKTLQAHRASIRQFLDPVHFAEGRHELYHQSLVDFLLDRRRAEGFWIDAASAHGRLVDHYWRYWGRWAACDQYGLRHLPEHLCRAGQVASCQKLLSDFGWLEAKLRATDISALLADFALLDLGSDEALRLLRDSLRLSAYVLYEKPEELPSQLLGRMGGLDSPEIEKLLQVARRQAARPWLWPKWPSLTRPGGPLVRILEGHQDEVKALALSADSSVAVSGSYDSTVKVWDVASGTLRCTLEGHEHVVNAVALSADGTTAVSGASDKTVKVWDVASGTLRRTLLAGCGRTTDGDHSVLG